MKLLLLLRTLAGIGPRILKVIFHYERQGLDQRLPTAFLLRVMANHR